jgi:hypothetical protein
LTFTLVGDPFALIRESFALVGKRFALICEELAIVGAVLALLSDPVSFVSWPLPRIHHPSMDPRRVGPQPYLHASTKRRSVSGRLCSSDEFPAACRSRPIAPR